MRLEDSKIRVWCEQQTVRTVVVFAETSEGVDDLNEAFAECLGDLDLFDDRFALQL